MFANQAKQRMDARYARWDAKGEGSRGGHVIGHTTSGKPIYSDAKHPAHGSFTQSDHLEAVHTMDEHFKGHSKTRAKFGDAFHHIEEARKKGAPEGLRVVGKTKSGKFVMSEAKHPTHKNFTPQDHHEAGKIAEKSIVAHQGMAATGFKGEEPFIEKHRGLRDFHRKQADKKRGF